VKDYREMLALFNVVLQQTPTFGDLGPPIYMLMYHVMNTKAGFETFKIDRLNEQFKKLFTVWTQHLDSPNSRDVLSNKDDGWFREEALRETLKDFGDRPFEEVYVCKPDQEYWGYSSFDDYFNRLFHDTIRPVESHERDDIIGGACESVMYKIAHKVNLEDEFWIKGEPYSLRHMLHASEFADGFDGGSIIQGFLQVTSYHRWHAPVSGTIRKIVDVPGTYFTQSPAVIGEPTEEHPYLRSLAYLTAVAARQLIFIEADNPAIGLMCFIAIGMTEISTCEATVTEGQHVHRGHELGMFHFGGSSHALVFRAEANVVFFDEYSTVGNLIKVNAAIGGVNKS
jgi:phosphatidylserine decarboxylase